MRHATEADLDRIEGLLVRIRCLDGMVERKRGNFQRRSEPFLHVHEDSGDVYADVRLADDFVRRRVSTPVEQAAPVGEIEAPAQPTTLTRRISVRSIASSRSRASAVRRASTM